MSILDDPEKARAYRHNEMMSILYPLMHREDANAIQMCADIDEKMRKQCAVEGNAFLEDVFAIQKKFAISHKEPVEKFGRYPSRNKAIGRENTPEEEEFLKSASTWGQ